MMNERDNYGRIDLHYAALRNDPIRVGELLEQGADIDAADYKQFTPLHLAAQETAVSAMRVLLEHGARVDAVNTFGNTPLFVAVANSKGAGDAIKLLLGHGADPMRVNHYGQSPIGLAELIANYDVRRFFSEDGRIRSQADED